MNWFKNLNAMPRLMSSFGVLLMLTLGISYLAITNLSEANNRVGALYNEDMIGAMSITDINYQRAMNGRSVRDAMLHINEPAVVAEDEKNSFKYITLMQSDIETAEKGARSKESKDVLAIMRTDLPEYEKGHRDIYQHIEAKDLAGAQATLTAVTEAAKPLFDAGARAVEIKQQHAQEKFDVSNSSYQTARNIMISASLLSLVFGIILSIVIARGFSLPMGQAVTVLEKVADGDLTVMLDVNTKEEVGRMAGALNRAVEKLNNTLQEVADSAANASSSSQQLAAAAESIASGAQEQAASLEETSASLEQITAAVRQSADNANQASQLASGSKDSALQGQEVVSNAINAMAEINAASAKISDIISTIDEIAFQTNLLAVNAAVEAARAGDEGRGFAVVASEVRSLAQRSAVAAKEIKVLIQDSLRKVEAGSGLVNRSGETLQGIVGSVKRVTDIVGEIAAASGEQSTGIEQVNTAMTQMDQVTQSNSAQTEELSATAQSLSEQSAHLMELVSTFILSKSGRNARDRQVFQPHEASPAHSVGASLVQSARPNLVHSAPQSSQAAQRPSKAVRSAAPAKSSPRPRASKANGGQQPVLAAAAAAPNGSGGSDASFEEF
ncbi:MAG: methyl-accepting chemotaxis protein [Terracidiphilus sp.]|jgi:methyl-accepting chemotaxis protein